LSQERAPFYESLAAHIGKRRLRFHVPGHKGAGGCFEDFGAIFGRDVFDFDLTELDGLDDLHHPQPGGALDQAQALAAEAYGAGAARFLAGGATAGVLAMVLAAVGPGKTLLACHPFHRSVAAAAVMAGCSLRVIPPGLSRSLVPLPPPAEVVAAELAASRPAALLVTSPTYHGVTADIRSLAAACRDHRVPLLVDAAHGAHFGHAAVLPPAPPEQGADACVVSLHKTAGALTPGAILLLGQAGAPGSGGPDSDRVDSALRFVQTSSPSFAVLASLDLARRRLVLDGEADWARTATLSEVTRDLVEREAGGRLVAFRGSDPTRLVFELTQEAPEDLTGPAVAAAAALAGIDLEMAGWATVVAVATPGDTEKGHRDLARELVRAVKEPTLGRRDNGFAVRRELALSLEKDCWEAPRTGELLLAEAFQKPRRRVPLARAAGCVAADVVSPYPPGVPLLLPGQRIGPEVARYLEFLGRSGGRVHGMSLSGVEVVG
jgi:arginine/lysine/ornithine decarboxylase